VDWLLNGQTRRTGTELRTAERHFETEIAQARRDGQEALVDEALRGLA
jgi:hypothetical protein